MGVFLILFLTLFACGQSKSAKCTVDELLEGLRAVDEKAQSWYIEYESDEQNHPGAPPGGRLYRVVAAIAPDRYYHYSAKHTDEYSWHEDPLRQRLIINGACVVSERPFDRMFRIRRLNPKDGLPGTAPEEFLFMALGWWPLREWAPPKRLPNGPCVLRDVVHSGGYAVREAQELVGDRWCHVLESDYDRLWADSARRGVLLRREVLDPENGAVLQRIEMRDHAEVSTGIWVPMTFVNAVFGEPHTSSDDTTESTLRVVAVKVNEPLPNGLFEYKPRPGSIQFHADGHVEQAVPAGTEHLDDIANWIKMHSFPQKGDVHMFGHAAEALIECAIAAGCVCIMAVGRRNGRSSATCGLRRCRR